MEWNSEIQNIGKFFFTKPNRLFNIWKFESNSLNLTI